MLFEKRSLSFFRVSLEKVAYIGLSVFLISYLGYLIFKITEVTVDSSISVLDLINGFAQIATAAAFILALVQYKKSSKQQRQTEISNEAKSQISKMNDVIKFIETGSNTNLENLNKSITLLSNLAINFDVLFESLDEDIQKAIVRMHWQDMYFNHLSHSLMALEILPILEKTEALSKINLKNLNSEVLSSPSYDEVFPVFKKYFYVKSILESPKIKELFSLKDKLESLDTFTYHFLNNSNLNDHLYGLLSIVDIRAKAPLLAVASPAEWALALKVKESKSRRKPIRLLINRWFKKWK